MALGRWVYGFISRSGVGGTAARRETGVQLTTPGAYSQQAASPVTIDSAMQVAAVWACVRVISEAIASMPVNIYKVDTLGVRTLNPRHPLALLFSGRPNQWQTRLEFFETMTMQLALLGNAYALVQRNAVGEVSSLIPVMTDQMETSLLEDGTIVHKYQDDKHTKIYAQDSVWHVKILGNGIVGLSPLGYARNSVSIAQASDNTVNKLFRNGAKPSGILTIDKLLTDAQRAAIKKNFEDLQEGSQDRLFVLEAGMKYDQVSMTPQDIELLSTRRFQVEDVCRFFGVPPVVIGHMEGQSAWGSGVTQILQAFYKTGIRPYLERYEESIRQWLMSQRDRATHEVKFDFQDFLRPDQGERFKMYKEAVTGGFMTPNEARLSEGWAQVEGGESAYMQQQMTPLAALQTMDRGAKPVESGQKMMDSVNVSLPSIHISPPSVHIEGAHIHPANVNVKNEVAERLAPQVTVMPAEVRVDNQVQTPSVQVDVAAPAVKVENTLPAPTVNVKLPRRKTKTSVSYDAQSRIKETTQIEEDV